MNTPLVDPSQQTPKCTRKRKHSLTTETREPVRAETENETNLEPAVIAVQEGESLTVLRSTEEQGYATPLDISDHPLLQQIPRTEEMDLLRSKLALLGRETLVQIIQFAASRDAEISRLVEDLNIATLCVSDD
eukprot:Gregarina_sp_Poly_1__5797@NODE_304_length_9736_cov_136_409039_g263_i0_p10_GENE_NODE_304_length_9736_cov_136_409039_g263_i0NODE_304_length_9736_cov_136_409039_g263_i0_p10_ORF_typecomplete_len133_score26_08LpxB/PF02684_15/0_023_NODE_304_length_9736_cov_136_409039_g263_i082248622